MPSSILVMEESFLNAQTSTNRDAYLFLMKFEYLVYKPMVCLLLMYTFVEAPMWCENGHWLTFMESPLKQCPFPGGSDGYFSRIPFLPKLYSSAIEGLCLLVILIHNVFKMRSERCARIGKHNKTEMLVVIAMIVDFFVFFALNYVIDYNVQFRIAGYGRLALFCFALEFMQKALNNVYCMFKEFLNVALLLFGTVVFFAWVAAMALDDLDTLNKQDVPMNFGFESLTNSLYTLFEASTTQNFPGQMVPLFVYSRLSFLPFFVFMVLTVMIFLNVVLAVVYDRYSSNSTDAMEKFFGNRCKGLAAAFYRMASSTGGSAEPVIEKPDFERLVECLNQSPVIQYVSKRDLSVYWDTLDEDKSGNIDAKEFYTLCDILQYSFSRVPDNGFLSDPPIWLKEFVRGGGKDKGVPMLERIMYWVLAINSILVIVESLQDLGNLEFILSENAWSTLEFVFSIFYVIEIMVRLSVISWEEVMSSTVSVFDFVTTAVLFTVGVLWAYPGIYVSSDILRLFSILRLLRLLRLLSKIERFQFICGCIWGMLCGSSEQMGLLFFALYAWAYTGVMVFGGLVYDNNELLDGTDYRDSGFDIFNFNDIGLGLVSLFANLITGFVPEFYGAFCIIEPYPFVGAIFWGSFYAIGVLIIFNVFASFIIDLFLELMKDENEEGKESPELTNDNDGMKVMANFRRSNPIYEELFQKEIDLQTAEDDTVLAYSPASEDDGIELT
uniref:EF-hand domain-containing protein n=2 Tax=Octactis speculum TaxID=3111310 RepID=A0A7S2MR56_9STRA|mmetsp:Transcript_8744/g.11105  ORF Transcript_8744/g.11105 Transcript_8744/m.11105 type:complete len:724 (+) Transcript_8744:285-2456(+)